VSRRLVWTVSARADYLGIIRYVARSNPDAAERIGARIEATARKLAERSTGRPGRVTGTYEKAMPSLPYIIAYEIVSDPNGEALIAILHIIHSARDWPAEAWPKD
jgi:toxin ParE1/3/4